VVCCKKHHIDTRQSREYFSLSVGQGQPIESNQFNSEILSFQEIWNKSELSECHLENNTDTPDGSIDYTHYVRIGFGIINASNQVNNFV